MKKYKTLLVGNFHNNWSLLSQFADGMEISGAVATGEEGLNIYGYLRTDVIFVDAFLKGMSGFEMARFVKEQDPAVKVVIISEKFSLDFFNMSMELGLEGYISRNMNDDILNHAIKNIRSGKNCFDSAIAQMLIND
ncbi:MAG TPA: response regulator, partial [Chryseosolibacter sp.]|nr:response regulator [Chryseosolibacter sp.]